MPGLCQALEVDLRLAWVAFIINLPVGVVRDLDVPYACRGSAFLRRHRGLYKEKAKPVVERHESISSLTQVARSGVA